MIAELIYLRMFQSPDWGLGAAISVVLVIFVGAADGAAVPLRAAKADGVADVDIAPDPSPSSPPSWWRCSCCCR